MPPTTLRPRPGVHALIATLAAAAALAPPALAQPVAHIIQDFNTADVQPSSNPIWAGDLAGRTLVATNSALYAVDRANPDAPPVLLLSGFTTSGTGVTFPAATLNGRLFFAVRSLPSPFGGLYVTDGTPAGTQLLQAGNIVGVAAGLTQVFALSSVDGQLYRTDGTLQGTRAIARADAFSPLETLGDMAIFERREFSGPRGLSVTDGTTAGTRLLVSDGSVTSWGPIVRGGQFLFARRGLTTYRTDGTPEGTVSLMLPPIDSQGGLIGGQSNAWAIRTLNNTVEVYVLSGSADGAVLVATLPARNSPRPAAVDFNGSLLLSRLLPPNSVYEVVRIDPVPAPPVVLYNSSPLNLLSTGSSAPLPAVAGDRGHFLGFVDRQNRLFATDGTPGGTQPVPGGDLGAGRSLEPLGTGGPRLYLRLSDSRGIEPWFVSPDSGGPQLLADLVRCDVCPTQGSSPLFAPAGAEVVLLPTQQPGLTRQPYVSDGTVAGTQPLGPALRSASLGTLTGEPLLAGRVGDGPSTLWAYRAGALVPLLTSDSHNLDAAGAVRFADRLIVPASAEGAATSAAGRLLAVGVDGANPETLAATLPRLTSAAVVTAGAFIIHNTEILLTDGTAAGTTLVSSGFQPTSPFANAGLWSALGSAGGWAFFRDGASGDVVVTDGSAAGTSRFAALHTRLLLADNQFAYFVGPPPTGTSASTQLSRIDLATLVLTPLTVPTPSGSLPSGFVRNGRIYFATSTGVYRTTPALEPATRLVTFPTGTFRLAGFGPDGFLYGVLNNRPVRLADQPGAVEFLPVVDPIPAPPSSTSTSTQPPLLVGSRLFFTLNNSQIGTEPYVLNIQPADIASIGGMPGQDGLVTVDDYTAFINAFASDDLLADIVSIGGFPPPDGMLTVDDYTTFINAFAASAD